MEEKYSFKDALEKDGKELGFGGGASDFYYKLEDGNKNVCRVLTPGVVFKQYFLGKGMKPAIAYGYDKGDSRRESDEVKASIRYCLYVLDRNDGKVKMAEFSYSIQKAIGELQENPDYAFETIPMPYDIRITYNKGGSPASMYTVSATPNQSPLTEDEKKALADKLEKETPEQHVEKKKERQIESDQVAGVWLSPEARAKRREDFVNEMNASAEALEDGDLPAHEYPEEDDDVDTAF